MLSPCLLLNFTDVLGLRCWRWPEHQVNHSDLLISLSARICCSLLLTIFVPLSFSLSDMVICCPEHISAYCQS